MKHNYFKYLIILFQLIIVILLLFILKPFSCNVTFNQINCLDDLINIIAAILITITGYWIVYSLKPNLKISKACYDESAKKIRIEVENIGRFNAVNLRIEVCAINCNRTTTNNLTVEQEGSFLILPSGKDVENENHKTFKAIVDNEIITEINSGKKLLRVRIHSYHEFSGLGKAEQKIFNKI
jgi:hypothetical protein